MTSPDRTTISGGVATMMRLAALLVVCLWTETAWSQTFISRLPKQDGEWVLMEGPHIEKTFRPKSDDGDLELSWRCDLTIKSVGQETAEFQGEQVPCRWVEFKVEFKSAQGQAKKQEIQAAPFGTRIYKVLVPETAVTERSRDDQGLPITYLPIVKGYRKFANRDPVPVQEKVLVVYPLISLVTHYNDLKKLAEEAIELKGGTSVAARSFKGTRVLTSTTSKSSNEATLWYADEVPFGLTKYQVKIQRFEKDATEPEDAFHPTTEITSELIVVDSGTDAQSELPDLK